MKTFICVTLAVVVGFGFVTANADGGIDQDAIYVNTVKDIDMRLNGYAYFRIRKIGEERKKIVDPLTGDVKGIENIAVPVYVDFIRSNKRIPTNREKLQEAWAEVVNIAAFDVDLQKFYLKLWENKPGAEFKNVLVFSHFAYVSKTKTWLYLHTSFGKKE